MRRRLGRLRRSLARRVHAFRYPPGMQDRVVPAAGPGHADERRRRRRDRGLPPRLLPGLGRTGAARRTVSWFGYRTIKTPIDMWIYQEIVTETKPEVIVECGTAFGGSSLYFASLLDLLGRGEVITIDIEARAQPAGPSADHEDRRLVDRPGRRRATSGGASAARRTMVILDSDHHEPHVAAELRSVQRTSCRSAATSIVEDTNLNGHPVLPDHGPGPFGGGRGVPAGRAGVRGRPEPRAVHADAEPARLPQARPLRDAVAAQPAPGVFMKYSVNSVQRPSPSNRSR